MTNTIEELGPVDYLVIEFPGNKMTGEALPLLVDLVEDGIIRILDLVFIRKDVDGSVTVVEVRDFDGDGQLDLAVFEGASSGLIDEGDVASAGDVIEAGSSAGILLFENRWAAPLVGALHRSGAELVASGRIPAAELLEAIDSAEAVG